jgi:adenylate kinase family enzyme
MEKFLAPKLIIVRGVPGAGKTTLSEKINNNNNTFTLLDPDNINKVKFLKFIHKHHLNDVHLDVQKY